MVGFIYTIKLRTKGLPRVNLCRLLKRLLAFFYTSVDSGSCRYFHAYKETGLTRSPSTFKHQTLTRLHKSGLPLCYVSIHMH
jgi:hypothetical protein